MSPFGNIVKFCLLPLSALNHVECFSIPKQIPYAVRAANFQAHPKFSQRISSLASVPSDDSDGNATVEPQAFSTGYSQNPDLHAAVKEATVAALKSLPSKLDRSKIDLGLVYVSSIYDGQYSPTSVVPEIVNIVDDFYGVEGANILQKLVGCYSGGLVGCKESTDIGQINTVESEGAAGVVINLCILPDTTIKVRVFKYGSSSNQSIR